MMGYRLTEDLLAFRHQCGEGATWSDAAALPLWARPLQWTIGENWCEEGQSDEIKEILPIDDL